MYENLGNLGSTTSSGPNQLAYLGHVSDPHLKIERIRVLFLRFLPCSDRL